MRTCADVEFGPKLAAHTRTQYRTPRMRRGVIWEVNPFARPPRR
jgi:hypothetical protein